MSHDPWRIACFRHGKHRQAQRALDDLGFRHYCPMEALPKGKSAPLFRTYLFVTWQDGDRWQAINNTKPFVSSERQPAVQRMAGTQIPWIAPSSLIEGLQRNEGIDGLLHCTSAHSLSGARYVAHRAGPFEGIACEVLSLDHDERVTVLSRMFGKEFKQVLPAEQLVRVDQ